MSNVSRRSRRNGPRVGVAVACLAILVGAACSSDDDGDDGSAATSPEDAEDRERFRTDGLTLVYPTDVFETVATADPPAEGAAVTADFAAGPEPAAGRITVVVARTATGADVSGLSAEDSARLAELESMDGDDPPDGTLEFVNGVGVRSDEDGAYAFEGLTTDGRFLVSFTAAEGSGDEGVLDEMIETVFVDGASELYATEECADGVELITENGLPEGATAAPGEEVTATWEIRNSGDCTWTDGYSWVFTGGEPVTVVSTTDVAGVGPGDSTEVSVVFLAPAEAGRYSAQWQLQSPADFDPLGTPAFVTFRVES